MSLHKSKPSNDTNETNRAKGHLSVAQLSSPHAKLIPPVALEVVLVRFAAPEGLVEFTVFEGRLVRLLAPERLVRFVVLEVRLVRFAIELVRLAAFVIFAALVRFATFVALTAPVRLADFVRLTAFVWAAASVILTALARLDAGRLARPLRSMGSFLLKSEMGVAEA
jgi:hypothetical protein